MLRQADRARAHETSDGGECTYSGIAKAAGTRQVRIGKLLASVSGGALALSLGLPAAGQTWTGTTSTDWAVGSNWSGGVAPSIGDVTISTVSPNPTVLGVSSPATATSANVFVGTGGGSGSLTIQNGSTLTSNATAYSRIGLGAGSSGVVTVTGPGSRWMINGAPALVSLVIGRAVPGTATGTLNVNNGGAVQTAGDIVVGEVNGSGFLNVTSGGTLITGQDGYIGRFGGSNGTALISGAGSNWTIANRLFVGNGGPGALTISDNATVDVGTSTTVGSNASQGTLSVTSGGTLQTQTLVRGNGPVQVTFDSGTLRAKTNTTSFVSDFTGTELNIASGGLTVDTAGFNVTASSPFSGTGTFTKIGAGTLTLTGANSTAFSGVMAINAGTLSVAAATNLGTGGLSFDGGTLRNTGAFTSALPVTLNAGGGTFQTDANLTVAGAIGGGGGLTKTGASTLTLTGANTYSGQSWIQSGTLALSGSGAIAGSSRVVADGTFDISAVTPTSASIRSLAGAGTVALGAKTLSLTNANDTFAGVITGTAGLAVSGGTQTLTGISNYTGATNVSGTGTLQLLNGGQITGTSGIQLGQLNSMATATVSGTGSLLQTTGSLIVGINTGSSATVNVLEGGVIRTAGTAVVGHVNAQTAVANVDGEGSLLDIGGNLTVGATSASTNASLNVTNGGTVRSLGANVGYFATGIGTKSVLISGPGSSWAVTNTLNITGGASMAVLNGGAATAATSGIGSGGTSTLLVSGMGSSYAITGDVAVGGLAGSGTGAVTLADGGSMTVGGTLSLATGATRTGILNIGGAEGQAATGAGTLDAATLAFGPGTSRVNFNHTDAAYLFSAAMSGGGSVNQTGPGTTILTADNTYTGGTTISAGTLQLGNGGTTGSIVGNVANNGVLAFSRSDAYTFSGLISGSGSVSQIGPGTTILTADNTYTGGTTISAGTLQLGNGGASGSIVGNVANNGELAFDRSDAYTFGGVISGAGSVTQVGPGTTILTADNTYTGGTTISAGTLQLGNGGASGSIVGDVANNGVLVFNRSDASTFGLISGAGSVTQVGPGTTILTADNTYTGGTTISAGTLQLGNGGTTGSIVGNVANNGALVFNRSDAYTFSGLVSGSGSVTQVGPGTTILTADNTYTGGTTISAGTLQLGNGGASGSIVGNVANNGALVFNRSDAYTFSGLVSGLGSVSQIGPGITILTADNTYTGGTTISAGTLQLGNGGASGSILGDVLNNGRLAIERTGTSTLGGLISGSGTVDQIGSGVTVLAGDNSYTGATTVANGTLIINGNQSAATGLTTVRSGATLGGVGTLGGSVAIADGGILAPGQSPGTLTINGSLSLAPASELNFEFGQANVAGGPLNDLVVVGGDLALDGTLNVTTSAGGSFLPGVYRVISYGGALTDNGLALGATPPSSLVVQTSIANQVNLVNTTGLTLNFWDGAAGPKNNGVVNGGDGVWQNSAGNDSWTTTAGTPNAPYSDGAFPVFAGSAGTVTVDNSLGQVSASGMQFATDGYRLGGGSIALVGAPTIIRVGDGTAAGAGYTATIDNQLTGTAQLVKADLGTLVLNGVNSYSGGTLVQGGTLRISRDANLGAASGGLTLDGGTLQNTAAFATTRAVTLGAAGGTFQTGADLTLAGAISGAGALTKTGGAALILAAANAYSGTTTVTAGTLRAGAATVLSAASAHLVQAGATLDLNGFDQTVAALSNAGTVSLNGAPGTLLTVAGSYVGTGGVVQLNTVLGGDTSSTDRLVVLGDTAGNSALRVTNRGGTGAPTVEGIKVVDVAGASNGVFTLQGDYAISGQQAIIGGAYAYTLQRNGAGTPNAGDWYLRSSLASPGAAPPAPGSPPVPSGSLAPAGPLYQPGVPLYEAYSSVLLGLNSLPTLQQRVGNRYSEPGTAAPSTDPQASTGGVMWGRVEGTRFSLGPKSSTSATTGDVDQLRLQAGLEGQFLENQAGRLLGGLTLQYGNADAKIRSFFGLGRIQTDGYGFGGTLTWYGHDGLYVDGQAQATWFDSRLSSLTLGRDLARGNDGFGYAFGIEVGKRFNLGGGFGLTPQAQLVHSSVDFDGFTDPFGARVSSDEGSSLTGRVGLAADYKQVWRDAAGKTQRVTVYGIANLYNEFQEKRGALVSGTPVASADERLAVGFGAGGTYSWDNERLAVFGELSVKTSVNSDNHSYGGKAGFRMQW